MLPVNFITEVENTLGTIGYSVLQRSIFDGEPERKTVLFLRDREGYTQNVVIVPAETLRGSF
jgi:hypothetical protein